MLFKAVTVMVLGAMTAILVRKVMEQVEASKARAKVHARRGSHGLTKLRRDPQTGIYHPES